MAVFDTHVGLRIEWANKEVVIIGERRKRLYPLRDEEYTLAGAKTAFDYACEHYRQREAAAEFGPCDDPNCELTGQHSQEAHVAFFRKEG